MIFGQDRHELRKTYADAWQKYCDKRPMSPLEAQIAAVISEHPEYQDTVTSPELDRDFTPEGGETNPFLHMGLHLGLREQVATNRPAGIAEIFERLAAKALSAHAAEHQMIECLAEALWEAQSQNRAPDDRQYMECLRLL